MYQDLKVAVVSQDTQFSDALCTLFGLERLGCAALPIEEGLTYLLHESRGCLVLYAGNDEALLQRVAMWQGPKSNIIVLSDSISGNRIQNLIGQGIAGLLTVPVNSRQLLRIVYSVLGEQPGNPG